MREEQLCLLEDELRVQGYTSIAGVDEAGRGPLAGPVVAAACILPPGLLISGIDDSKKLSPARRLALFEQIKAHPQIRYGIGVVDAKRIDEINILQATFEAMRLALSKLSQTPDYILVDGNLLPQTPFPGRAVVKGDSLCQAIAAASILAKETRDALMQEYHQIWPQYDFAQHKGYGTKKHLEAIQKYGLCPIHRMSFAPLKN